MSAIDRQVEIKQLRIEVLVGDIFRMRRPVHIPATIVASRLGNVTTPDERRVPSAALQRGRSRGADET